MTSCRLSSRFILRSLGIFNEVYPAAGAGFVVAQAGDIMTMPGLPKEPAAERMAIRPDGSIVGLF